MVVVVIVVCRLTTHSPFLQRIGTQLFWFGAHTEAKAHFDAALVLTGQ